MITFVTGFLGLCEPAPCSISSPTSDAGDLGGHERRSFSPYVGVGLPLCRTFIPPSPEPSLLVAFVSSVPLSPTGFPPPHFRAFSFHCLPIARGRSWHPCGMSGSHSPSPSPPFSLMYIMWVLCSILRFKNHFPIKSRGGRAARPQTLVLFYYNKPTVLT